MYVCACVVEEETMVVEGRGCVSQTHGFKVRCMSNHNCDRVCKNQGFSAGVCRGVRGRCFCTKPC
ncbi:putative knottin, scorpion toxin, defensin, plant, knottin, scorpion toxin-like superfamily [Helianthus annuus]|nr:putative knottin, scorpion toxin, defensin, plant, knottin, scorpion toxin-like superfamily [Helianthus annuus]